MKTYKNFGTKAETLNSLLKLSFPVPKVYYFSVAEWENREFEIINHIISDFKYDLLAIRSSAVAEDSSEDSMAGAFESKLNVEKDISSIKKAVNKVIKSFDNNKNNQILVQPMISNVAISGVIMTNVLDDGSPYYVINYDDSTGLTDTVTNGSSINKTVYVYNGVDDNDFDFPFLLLALKLVRNLQKTFVNIPLDIEFAIDLDKTVHLLQVRRITTMKNWEKNITDKVSSRIDFLKSYIGQLGKRRPNIYGEKTLLGFMPDWNPAEMIGVIPHPLAMSLYRELITKRVWSLARSNMGYRKMPNVELMVSLFGRPYIDVRNSINSFLPDGLTEEISEKIVNSFIKRLDENPQLHDKIEFEVVHTAYDFDFDLNFKKRYGNILSKEEFLEYRGSLRDLTKKAIENSYNSSLNKAVRSIEKLKTIQRKIASYNQNSFSIANRISTLIDECKNYGTISFSVIARHGFIAEALLRSAVNNKVISKNRIIEFKSSFDTISGQMSNDFQEVLNGSLDRKSFLNKYGHLRPSSYDILSLNYSKREKMFSGAARKKIEKKNNFELSQKEKTAISILLGNHGFDNIKPVDLFDYAKKAIIGREYAKFIFTKHLSDILENISRWGKYEGFSRKELAMLTINDVLSVLFAPLTDDTRSFFSKKIEKAKFNYSIATSFKLSYLIRSTKDVHIVPMQRSFPNFIGNKKVEGDILELTPYSKNDLILENKIVCIESADPGYDWIFTRKIIGLITKYGGANSHMAIRSAEYRIPAAIGCGDQNYNRIINSNRCILDCQKNILEPQEI